MIRIKYSKVKIEDNDFTQVGNVHVLCNKCGKVMRMHKFEWINGIVLIEVEGCSCVYDRRMEKFNEELGKIV